MVLYRRNRVSGGAYFFTLVLDDRNSQLLVKHIAELREAWRSVRRRYPHEIVAAVVLPDHLHAVLRFSAVEGDYASLWREIKKGFTRRLLTKGIQLPPRSEGGYRVWQRRFWEHTIRDEADLTAHVDYIHYNPLKHRLVTRTRDWPHSSFHRFVAAGQLAIDWGDATPPVTKVPTTVGE